MQTQGDKYVTVSKFAQSLEYAPNYYALYDANAPAAPFVLIAGFR